MSEENEKKLKFLGLGTMVEVENTAALPDTKYVVIARAVGKNREGETILRYRLAPHPFGDVSANQGDILTVEESEITNTYVEGYRDKKDDDFLDDMMKQMTGALKEVKTTEKAVIPIKDVEVKEKILVVEQHFDINKEQEMLKQDPFYKFRK
ncbi:DUF4176 domain-containing protein [Lactococcus nasutitermitis]|uniref:DUF4176 domain-containing protein n=1 Tax=Lactococcus nasutitermitis TaxID=1652957 RepID=A0ABV9JD31_9LACT|nr:DUF4176 domain-containing protein [Lactococcus nasutitermitis]